ncbi:hypothetical protein [Dyella acidisoli]|uniref:Uncharacterized protein n=1 Tax=Dyella acidisoli TaxID=1867834 RepID=A0ABQ5XJT3_9GAMM|nr:hypothetical protein [Dyella acidisoli]GLQ91961.1 hypothetical protein GCM10007901_09120 [Dyella acidisoli]
MPQPKIRSPLMAGLGLRAFKGGAVVIGVAVVEGEPCVVLSTVLETYTQGDRLSFEPYRLAAETSREPSGRAAPEAAAIVAEGRRRQNQLATHGLQAIIHRLDAAGRKPAVAALLVNRAGWITDLLEYSLAWAEHIPVAENLAVREALRFAAGQCGVAMVEQDEKSLPELATKTLGVSSAELDARLKALGAPAGKPWRKEQKLACLSAWVALANRPVVEIDRLG